MNKLGLILLLVVLTSCNEPVEKNNESTKTVEAISKEKKTEQQKIIDAHLNNCALKFPLYSQERQKCLDAGLEKDPSIAYLWQQKAMPLFKQGKYEVGMEFIDKAVEINPERWQPYRVFIKCIFAKTYQAAIVDFQDLLEKYGNGYVMDHSYKFHIGLSYLQLNEFEKAEAFFAEDLREQAEQWGEDGQHHLDLLYYGIAKFEQGKLKDAITQFDKSLQKYPKFSDAQYYKAMCLYRMQRGNEASELMALAKTNGLAGNTINEDNVIYERYPYEVRW